MEKSSEVRQPYLYPNARGAPPRPKKPLPPIPSSKEPTGKVSLSAVSLPSPYPLKAQNISQTVQKKFPSKPLPPPPFVLHPQHLPSKPLPPLPKHINPIELVIGAHDESNPRPLRALISSVPFAGKELFSASAQIALPGGIVTETLEGVSSKEMALKMVHHPTFPPSLMRPVETFLNRDTKWVSSSALRSLSEKNEGRVEKFAVIELTNHQVHSLKESSGKEICRFEQFGALGDNRNAYLSLADLKTAITDENFRNSRLATLRNRYDTEGISKTEKAVLNFALSQLNNPQAGYDQKKALLEQQMLLTVYNRLQESVKAGTMKGDAFHLSHLSLLNPTKHDVDTISGLLIDEKVLIDDMKNVFDEFNNQAVLFDSEVPYRDEKGIHMPVIFQRREPLTLHTHFGNVSVQGQSSQEGNKLQKDMNSSVLLEMERDLSERLNVDRSSDELKLLQKKLREMKKANSVGKYSLQVAADILLIQMRLGWLVSTGCYGNKDRGGILGMLLCRNFLMLQKSVAKDTEAVLKLRDMKFDALLSDSLAMKAAQHNNATQRALKVYPLADIENPKELLLVIKNSLKAGKDWVREKLILYKTRTKTLIF
jgi:hypothetical protein